MMFFIRRLQEINKRIPSTFMHDSKTKQGGNPNRNHIDLWSINYK